MAKKTQAKQELIVIGQETSPVPKAPVTPSPVQVPISFDAWWLQIQVKYKLRPELKNSVKRHFESRGFMNYKKFNQGLRDFGFRT